MNFVVALKAEALPLVESLGLTKESAASPFPLFASDRHRLVLSGVGKELAAKATNFLSERFSNPNQAWMNFGLSGHGTLLKGPFTWQPESWTMAVNGHSTQPSFLTINLNHLPCRLVPLRLQPTPNRLGTTWKPPPFAPMRPLCPCANSSKWSRSYQTTQPIQSIPLTDLP